jgi:protein SCO1/2
MHPRIRLVLGVALAITSAAFAAVLVLTLTRDDSANSSSSAHQFEGALSPEGLPPVSFRLRNQDGKTVDARDLRGDVTVLTFLYSTCEDTCPLQAQMIRDALDEVDDPPRAVGISVDPPRDNERNAQRFLQEQKVAGRMDFLLGDRSELEPIWRQYGIQPQGKGFEHTAHVFLLDATGRPRIGFPVNQLTAERLAHDIKALRKHAS